MRIGRYELIAEIARGGMGIVYLAVARGPSRFNKLVVVKELKPELSEDEAFLAMFLEEARLAARLNHRNIVQTHEVGNDGPHHFMVMDYLEGVTLGRIVRKKVLGFTLAMHLRVLAEMLLGLHHAHTLADYDGSLLGIVHRDATPQNVFVTYDGDTKLVDFGIAKALDSTLETRTGLFKGKPSYMAPEQITGTADPRSDLFTVGVMIWEAVAGQRMWKSTKASDVEVLTAMSLGRVPAIRDVAPDTPPALVAILDRALAKSRTDRFQTALEMRAAIEAYLVATGDDPSTQQIGAVVTEAFADTRAKMHMFIESHLADDSVAMRRERTSHLPPPSVSLESSSDPPSRHDRVPGSGPTKTVVSPGAPPPPRLSSSLAPPFGTLAPPAPVAAPVRRGLAIGLASFAAVAAVAAVGIALTVRHAKVAEPPTAVASTVASVGNSAVLAAVPAPSTNEAPAPTDDALPAVHELALAVFPTSARLVVDGAQAQNPIKKLCHHGNVVVVRASKTGYAATERSLPCERDQTVEIALVPDAPPAVVYRAPTPARRANPLPPPPPPPRAASTDVNAAGGTQPRRAIDPNNPYKR